MKNKNQITKRQFLKLMGGLSLGLLPFVSCFNRESAQEGHSEEKESHENDKSTSPKEKYAITDKDVVILKRDDEAFAKYNISYNKRISFLPKYIAVCFTSLGIQYALNKAKSEQLSVAVKSGGHSFEGFSSNNDGMVINLSQMKKVSWNEDHTIAVEPGVLLRELHEMVYAKGRLIPAGSCGGVGIAGLTLGGGYGFFSRKYGLTCDNLIDADIVLADKKILHAADDPKLLWALKGGGNGNFGIVSSLKFKTYSLPETFSSYTAKHAITDASAFHAILEKWMNSVKLLPEEAFAAFVQNGKTLTLLFTNYGAQSIENQALLFSENATSFSKSIDKPLVPSLKRFYGRAEPLFFKNASCGYFTGYADLATISTDIYEKIISQKGIIFQINTLGGTIKKSDIKTASCYPHRDYDFLGELQGYYDTKSQEPAIIAGFNAIQKLISENGIKAQYANYPDANLKDWQHAYYGNNYESLQQIKLKYDPDNVFKYPQGIELPANGD